MPKNLAKEFDRGIVTNPMPAIKEIFRCLKNCMSGTSLMPLMRPYGARRPIRGIMPKSGPLYKMIYILPQRIEGFKGR